MEILCREAAKSGFEFKAVKGQYNQAEIVFWGCICDKTGRRPEPKKVEQLSAWPEPDSNDGVVSFLCFVNYLREHVNPEWIFWEKVLSPFRKKGTNFKESWNKSQKVLLPDGKKGTVTPVEAFRKIRGMIASKPIVQCLAAEGELNDDVLGKAFQIVDVETRYRRDGEAVPSEGGGSQKQVIVRAADAPNFSL